MPGDLLESKANGLGPGKALRPGRTKGNIVLEYFDEPGQPPNERYTEEVPIPQLKRHILATESRVYWHRPNEEVAWGAGRVLSIAPDGEIEVKSAGGRDHRFFKQKDLYVRWSKPLTDPTSMAAAGVFESPHNVETRYPIIQAALQQRAATRALPGLLGLSAELHAHQLAAARRVLEDRIQRYLLADEVGLGKTIEALLILRELLLEQPDLEARLIVPTHLMGQWHDEINTKLHPELAPASELLILSHDDPESWEIGDIVIVDEAHHLVTTGAGTESFQHLRRICSGSPITLLLSATPALHNERAFLAMLHLLDPDVYDLVDTDGFRRRLESRQELGKALLGLTPDGPSFIVEAALNRLEAILIGQPELLDLVGRVRTADIGVRAEAIRALRQDVADTFQLHRRMIRTRRTEGLSQTFPLAGRHGCARLDLDDSIWSTVVDGVELAREQIAIAVEEGRVEAEDAAWILANVAGSFPDATAINWILEEAGLEATIDGSSTVDVLAAVADAASYELRTGENAVVFAPTEAIAKGLAKALVDLVGPDAVRVLTQGMDPKEMRRQIREHESSRYVNWLVVDRIAEHGTNLQYANLLLHIGLPGLVTQLEQRIGRIDRWSTAQHTWRALEATPRTGLLGDWSTVLQNGFDVHERSLAALQRAVEEQSLLVWQRLLDPEADVRTIAKDVSEALTAEVEAVREQDAIDAVVLGERDVGFAADVIACDRHLDQELGSAFDGLMSSEPGNLRFSREHDPVRGAGRYIAQHRSDHRAQTPLVPLWRLGRGLMDALSHPFASRRDVASSDCAPVLRAGFPLFEQVVEYLRHDDRGRAWGLWRYQPTHTGRPQIWLRVDAHIHADPATVVDDLDVDIRYVRRRLDSAFSPRVVSILRGPGGIQPTPEERERVLAPYSPIDGCDNGDYNLNRTRVPALLALLHGDLESFVRQGMDAIAQEITSEAGVAAAVEDARAELKATHAATTAALRRRLAGGGPDHVAVERELTTEDTLLPALLDSVANPTVTIDAIGIVVLSSENPWAQVDE